jgi:tRNA A-37 threonylcarbamoyl transferase component Bud32
VKHLEQNGIEWFIEGPDILFFITKQLTEEKEERRSYDFREYKGNEVFAKYFLEKGFSGAIRNRLSPRGKREFVLGTSLLSASIATPRPLGYGVGRSGSFVLQERLPGVTFLAAFEASSGVGREILLNNLALLLGRLRDHRVRHNDLHLENVLVSDECLYLIDLHKSVIRSRRFSKRDELINLAHSLTMIYDRMTEEEKGRFLNVYGDPSGRAVLEARLYSQWSRWIKRKKGRAFANTSRLRAEGHRVYVRGEEDRGTRNLKDIIKLDRKVQVERHVDHLRKIYSHKRRLRKAWENFVALLYLDLFVTPKPYFVDKGSIFENGFIAMEDLGSKGQELDRFLDSHYDGMKRIGRCVFVEQLADFLGGLLKKGVVHRDLKACNIFVGEGRLALLDVEDFLFRRTEEADIVRLLAQLATSIPARVRTRDRIMFLHRLAQHVSFDKKHVVREVREKLKGAEVIYEGASGLKRESLPGSPKDRH